MLAAVSVVFGGVSDCQQQDHDGDGYADDDCNDSDPNTYPGALELCDHVDNDCDGTVDDGLDKDGDGTTSCSGDCDDEDPAKGPQASDVPDGVDNDCDGFTDDEGWQWGSASTDAAKALALEGDLICVAGSTNGNLYQPSAGGSDAVVACFDRNGNSELEWQFGFPSQDSLYDIVLSGGNVFVGGTVNDSAFIGSLTWSQFGISGSAGNAVMESDGFVFLAGSEPTESGIRAFVARYELNGTPAGKWIFETGTKTSATGLAKRTAGGGGVTVVGTTDETVYGHIDGWLVELTTNLEVVGNVSVFGTAMDDFPHDIAITGDGSFIVVGNTYEENSSYTKGFVTKLGNDGWYIQSNGAMDDYFHGVMTIGSENYVIGNEYDPLVLAQIVVERLSSSGALLQKFIFGTPSDNDYGNGIGGTDEDGQIWITGSTGGPLFAPLQAGDTTTDCYLSPILF